MIFLLIKVVLAAKNGLTHANSRKISAYVSIFWISKSKNEVKTRFTGFRLGNHVLLTAD